ncbi:MAG: hypothetical protein ACLSVD_14115 [Eggerthellaceae bacterium]
MRAQERAQRDEREVQADRDGGGGSSYEDKKATSHGHDRSRAVRRSIISRAVIASACSACPPPRCAPSTSRLRTSSSTRWTSSWATPYSLRRRRLRHRHRDLDSRRGPVRDGETIDGTFYVDAPEAGKVGTILISPSNVVSAKVIEEL